jgi:hypothetical protein
MRRRYVEVIYIDRNPNDLAQGWGWVEMAVEDMQRFGISRQSPTSRTVTKRKLSYDSQSDSLRSYEDPYHVVRPPSRGRAGGKKFVIDMSGEAITIKAQKSLTSHAICSWVKTWASPETKIVTPGNRLLSLDGDKLVHQVHFIYFILNADINAIKIGRARNLDKRMQSLQTSSPTKLELIKSIQVESGVKAQMLEKSLHQRFQDIRLTGEWFNAEATLLEYIDQI